MRKIFKTVSIASALTLTVLSINAIAQSISITVSPLVTITQLKGAQARASFSISNSGTTPLRARIYAEDFDYDRDTGFKKISNHVYSANPYLQFSPKEVVVPPGVTRDVRVNITIPPSKPDGEYRVSVFTQDLTERKVTDPKTKYITIIRPQIGSIFFVSKGNIAAKLSGTSVSWNSETQKPRLVLKNEGQASAYPEVAWALKQGDREVANYKILGVVLQAGKERAIDLKIPTETKVAPGNYNLTGEISNSDGKKTPFSLPLTVPAK
jgi:P pilus assembly chaperone PapD